MKNTIQFFKLFVAIISLFAAFVGLSAQENPSFVAVRSGVSLPFGKYHEKSLDGGSFTTAGFNVSAEGAWFFNPKFGVGASVGMNMHPVDVWLLGYEIVQRSPELKDLYTRSTPYTIVNAMGGLYTQLPIIQKLSFTAKALGGLLYGQTPYQLYKPTYYLGGGPGFYEITPAKDWKFSWQAGVGLRYDITPCYALVFDSEIVYDQLSFGFVTGSGSTRYDVKTISFINTTLGVRFNL